MGKKRMENTPLEELHLCIQSLALMYTHFLYVCEGFMAVDMRFADSEEVEIGAIDDEDGFLAVFHFEMPWT